MESLETIMTNKLQYLFNGDVHVKQKDNVLIVDVYFYDSSLFHTTVLIPQETAITQKLCKYLASCIINDYLLWF